jgi:hypothetical protein
MMDLSENENIFIKQKQKHVHRWKWKWIKCQWNCYQRRCGENFLNASFQIENNKLEGNEKGSMHASLEKIACPKKNIAKMHCLRHSNKLMKVNMLIG